MAADTGAAPATLWLLRHPQASSAVLVLGAVLLWLGSQWPQVQAPLVAADGLAREDHLTLQALGLHRWVGSLPIVMWTIAALAVAVGRWVLGATRLPVVAVVAWGATALCWLGWASWAASAPQPVFVDVAVDVADLPAQAWAADAGRLGPAPGRWAGKCQRQDREIHCQIQGPQATWSVQLAAGRSETRGDVQLTWVGRAPAITAPGFDFLAPQGTQPASLVRLQDGKAIDTPALRARWLPAVATVSGPAVLQLGENASQIWTSPALAGPSSASPRATARVQTGELARIAVAPTSPRAQLWAWALVALAVAVLLSWPVGSGVHRPAAAPPAEAA